jgi:hypothetical protein
MYGGDFIGLEDFVLTAKKRRLLQEMTDKVDTQYPDCCPVLEDCIEQVHSCYLTEYASECYYRRINEKRNLVKL